MDVNSVTLAGTFARGPWKNTTPKGTATTKFVLRTSRPRSDKQDDHLVQTYGRAAEEAAQWTEGTSVVVRGELQYYNTKNKKTDQWETRAVIVGSAEAAQNGAQPAVVEDDDDAPF